MAMRMNHCASCQKHFFLTADTCPHCGAEATSGPVSRFVRQARMGGLMLFTALTTTACYGTPAQMAPGAPMPVRPTAEPIDKHVPKVANTAYLFITPKGQTKEVNQLLNLDKATIEGGVLTLKTMNGQHSITIEVPSADTFKTGSGVREGVNVSQMKRLEVHSSYPSGTGGETTQVELKMPGDTAIIGTLQVSQVTDTNIAGTLLLNANDQSVQLYFNAAR